MRHTIATHLTRIILMSVITLSILVLTPSPGLAQSGMQGSSGCQNCPECCHHGTGDCCRGGSPACCSPAVNPEVSGIPRNDETPEEFGLSRYREAPKGGGMSRYHEPPGGAGMFRHDEAPGQVMTLNGEVIDIYQITSRRGYRSGTHLLLQANGETTEVHLGPSAYLEKQNFSIEPEDFLEIEGRLTHGGSQPGLIAFKVTKGEQVLTLRDAQGMPLWRRHGLPGE
jgi:hypothetical protein